MEPVKREAAAQGWWRAADGYWYPPEARPGQLWKGEVIGPHGEEPPGPGWWLASDYQWYPPDAKPGELWRDPVAKFDDGDQPAAGRGGKAVKTATAPAGARQGARPSTVPAGPDRSDAALMTASGLVLIILGIALLAAIRAFAPDASTLVRLLAWLPVAVGSSVTLIGAVRYLGLAK